MIYIFGACCVEKPNQTKKCSHSIIRQNTKDISQIEKVFYPRSLFCFFHFFQELTVGWGYEVSRMGKSRTQKVKPCSTLKWNYSFSLPCKCLRRHYFQIYYGVWIPANRMHFSMIAITTRKLAMENGRFDIEDTKAYVSEKYCKVFTLAQVVVKCDVNLCFIYRYKVYQIRPPCWSSGLSGSFLSGLR